MRTAVASFEPPRRPILDFVPVPLPSSDADLDRLLGLLETGTDEAVKDYWGYGISNMQVSDLRSLFGFENGATA